MDLSIAKRILSKYESNINEYKIPMDLVDTEISEAIMYLCGKECPYVMSGYTKNNYNYYIVYIPDAKKFKGFSHEAIKYYQGLCREFNGNIFNSELGECMIFNLDISRYIENVDNCVNVLDNILIKNYTDKYFNRVDFLLVIKFSERQIMYFSVE